MATPKTFPAFHPDRPITSATQDALGRKGFSRAIADRLIAWHGEDCLVAAIYGGWGTGKSSVKNMIVERLGEIEAAKTADVPHVVEFNPWQFSGSEQLTGEFFAALSESLVEHSSCSSAKAKKQAAASAERLNLYGNLGKKNCELADADTQRIVETYLGFKETPESKIFPNAAFGYWKVVVERPLRLRSQLTPARIAALRFASGDEDLRAPLYDEFGDALFQKFPSIAEKLQNRLDDWGADEATDDPEDDADEAGTAKKGLPEKKKKKLLDAATWARDGRLVVTAEKLATVLGRERFDDHNVFRAQVDAADEKLGLKLTAADLKTILRAVSWRDEAALPVIDKFHKEAPDTLHGRYPLSALQSPISNPKAKLASVSFEPDPELRDSEQIPLLEAGGIAAFIQREVLPYTPDAWVKADATKIGYEISFTRHFYQPQPLRTLEEIAADIVALERETGGLLEEITKGGGA